MDDNELFALVEEAQAHRAAALESRQLADQAVRNLHVILKRMETAAANLAQAPDTLGKGVEKATREAFEPQVKEIVASVHQQVRSSVNSLSQATVNARYALLPWGWLLGSFLLGALAMGAFGYIHIQEPLEGLRRSQVFLFGEFQKMEEKIGKSQTKPAPTKPAPTKPAPAVGVRNGGKSKPASEPSQTAAPIAPEPDQNPEPPITEPQPK